MSRVYRVKLEEQVVRPVDTRESATFQLSLRELVERAETDRLLAEALREMGAEGEDDRALTLVVEGVTVRVEPGARTATVSVGQRTTVSREFEGEVDSYSVADDAAQARGAATQKVRAALDAEVEREIAGLTAAAEARLVAAEGAIVQTLREALGRTEAEAVKQKAEQMGRVTSVREQREADTGEHRLVIEVTLEPASAGGPGGRATITYVHDPRTGRRELHIDYTSDSDADIAGHERAHRRVVQQLVPETGGQTQTEVHRGPSDAPGPAEEHEGLPASARRLGQSS